MTIGLGVIGLGGISPVHLNGALQTDGVEIRALCDIDPSPLADKAEKYGIPKDRLFANHQALLESPDIDAVVISTPNDSHFEIACDAIRHGKPFALEKPVTLTGDEAAELNRRAKEKGVSNMVCFSYRYKSAARYAKWLIEQGTLGQIYHVYVQYFQGWGAKEELPLIWRFSKERSGSGALGDLGSHMLDLTRFLTGREFQKVSGHTGTLVKERSLPGGDGSAAVDVDDYCHVLAELDGGISATYGITRFAPGRGNYQRVEVYGSKGSLVYHLEREDELEVCIGDFYKDASLFTDVNIPERFRKTQMQSFSDILQGKGDGWTATVTDGYVVQQVMDAILRSAEEKRWIEL